MGGHKKKQFEKEKHAAGGEIRNLKQIDLDWLLLYTKIG
jgi:hypothetical protein